MDKTKKLTDQINWMRSQGLEVRKINFSPRFTKEIRRGLGYEIKNSGDITASHLTFMGIAIEIDQFLYSDYEITVEG